MRVGHTHHGTRVNVREELARVVLFFYHMGNRIKSRTWGPLSRQEILLSTGNLVNSLLLTLCQASISPCYILNLNPIPTDTCGNHLSSKRHLLRAIENHHRDPQLDTMQRSPGGRSLPPVGTSTSYLLHLCSQANVLFSASCVDVNSATIRKQYYFLVKKKMFLERKKLKANVDKLTHNNDEEIAK